MLLLALVTTSFLDSARFERWSCVAHPPSFALHLAFPGPATRTLRTVSHPAPHRHFKDHGLPGTIHDPLNQAAIADGSCRLLDPPVELDGFAFWRSPARVARVIAALGECPLTDKPSYFVRATSERLLIPCSTPAPLTPTNFTVAATAAAMQNWYHALCAPETDASWHGEFDPAEEVQQVALTMGFLCIAACDAAGHMLPARSMTPLIKNPTDARDATCSAKSGIPWSNGTDFTKATSKAQLASMAKKLIMSPGICGCQHPEAAL